MALALVCAVALAGAGGAAVYAVLKSDGRTGDQAGAQTGGQGSGSGSRKNPDAPTTPAPGGGGSSPAPAQDPKPVDTKGLDLPKDYHLTVTDDPLTPKNSDLPGVDFLLNGASYPDSTMDTENGRLVLLRTGEQGSLDTCRHTTRYTRSVHVNQLTKGAQLCLTVNNGTLALITFRGSSPASDPSWYITVDVRVWRNAVAPQQGS